MDGQEWTIVSTGKEKKRRPRNNSSSMSHNNVATLLSPDDAYDRLINLKKVLLTSSIWNDCASPASESLISSIISLGIGRLSASTSNSSWQCALLLLLRESTICLDIKYFEPLVDVDESALLKRFGLENDTKNEKGLIFEYVEGKLSENEGKILVYMPHCPYRLYCNIVWSFWGSLDRLLLIGNR